MKNKELFVGRQKEQAILSTLLEQTATSLIVVKGRRRIGKSRLIEEFGKHQTFYEFSGLLPGESTTAQDQRDEFARQLSLQTGLPEIKADDWGKLLQLLSEKISRGRVVVLFDEISWMGSKDPNFVGKLKIAWDLYFKKNPKLIFFFCGSVSAWIEENILGGAGFLGRPTLRMTLQELALPHCNQFWRQYQNNISAYEKLKLLAVTGGVPRYLELINPKYSAEENIRRLCFVPTGILTSEFKYIFTDIFGKRSHVYSNIVQRLAQGSCNQEAVAQALGKGLAGQISEYLAELVEAGFISRNYTWHLSNGKVSKLSQYRLKDNYMRFYLKYIAPNIAKIEKGNFSEVSLTALPGWDSMMGLQFENLVINNAYYLKRILGLHPAEIIFDNPFFQTKTQRRAGCQIDYVIQTRFNTVYICEIKFSRNKIGAEIIDEVKTKMSRLALPKNTSVRPVLIHVNGVDERIVECGFFNNIIDFSSLLIENS